MEEAISGSGTVAGRVRAMMVRWWSDKSIRVVSVATSIQAVGRYVRARESGRVGREGR